MLFSCLVVKLRNHCHTTLDPVLWVPVRGELDGHDVVRGLARCGELTGSHRSLVERALVVLVPGLPR